MTITSALFRVLSAATIALLLVVGIGAAVLGNSLSISSAVGAAALQDDGDDEDDGDDRGTVGQPTLSSSPRAVRIQIGSCNARGDVIAELISLRAPDGDDDDSDEVDRIEYGYTPSIPLTVDQMKGDDHAIVIYEDDDDTDRAIACASIGGIIDANGSLVIALRSLDGSGVTGVVVLSPNPANLSATQASIFIIGSAFGDDIGSRDDGTDDDTNTGGTGGTGDDGVGTDGDDGGTDDDNGLDDGGVGNDGTGNADDDNGGVVNGDDADDLEDDVDNGDDDGGDDDDGDD